jgi:hypothetical protein
LPTIVTDFTSIHDRIPAGSGNTGLPACIPRAVGVGVTVIAQFSRGRVQHAISTSGGGTANVAQSALTTVVAILPLVHHAVTTRVHLTGSSTGVFNRIGVEPTVITPFTGGAVPNAIPTGRLGAITITCLALAGVVTGLVVFAIDNAVPTITRRATYDDTGFVTHQTAHLPIPTCLGDHVAVITALVRLGHIVTAFTGDRLTVIGAIIIV